MEETNKDDFTKLNIAHVCYVRSVMKQQAKSYVYFEERIIKFLWFKPVVHKEGFYEYNYPDYKYISNEDIEKLHGGKFYCEGKKVFFKPFLRIFMPDGESLNKFFKTQEELNDFVKSGELCNIKWL